MFINVDKTGTTLTRLAALVRGGMFPQIIYGKENLSHCTIMAGRTTTPDKQLALHCEATL